ncbi:MAG: pentapeptide repeat-containing protein, partial [Rickettsiaceae bacterium]
MVKDLLVLSKDNVKVKGYFQENRDLFAGVINSIVKTTPGLEDYDLAGDLYKIVPDLLDHPDQLISIINLYEKGKYSEVGQEFLGLIQEDPKIKQYFTDNGELFKRILIDKTMGMKSYGVKDEVADIFKHIMKEQNISKIQGLLDQYEKGNWLGLVTDTCRMIEEDHKFAQYMRDNKESFNKIVTAIVDSYPMIKTYTGNVSVGTLAANLLQDPKQIREVVEGYQAGGVQMVKQGEKFLAAKAMDSDVRGVVLQVATGWIFADGSGKQEVINRIPETLIETRVVQENNVTLNDAARAVITAGDNSAKKQELNTLLDRNILFDGVTIGSTRKHVKLEHLDINNSFVNSQFNNVSFQGSKFTNASFTGATFTNTDFSKAEIDGATLNSLIPALKNGTISLNGSKIIGDMPASLDLSDISLQGVDLSAVTSMNDVNLRNTDLQGAILPTDQTILKTSYNLMSAKFDSEMSVLKEQNQNYMLDLIVDSIASRAEYLGGELLDPVLLRQNIEKLYIGDTPMGKELREAISQNPDSIKYKNFPVAVDSYKNTKDLLTTSAVMTLLYEN